jgi:DNA-binding NarL/FixJ family response regulator
MSAAVPADLPADTNLVAYRVIQESLTNARRDAPGADGVRPRVRPGRLAQLTAREIDVLRMLAVGHSNPEIAARLFISNETVKTHVSSILTKLQARDRTQAVIAAYEAGLVRTGAS